MIIACWSGPRNISTALMRSWSSRKDTFVTDEPFYSYYLKEKKLNNPSPPARESLGFWETVNLDCLSWDSRSSIMSIML